MKNRQYESDTVVRMEQKMHIHTMIWSIYSKEMTHRHNQKIKWKTEVRKPRPVRKLYTHTHIQINATKNTNFSIITFWFFFIFPLLIWTNIQFTHTHIHTHMLISSFTLQLQTIRSERFSRQMNLAVKWAKLNFVSWLLLAK